MTMLSGDKTARERTGQTLCEKKKKKNSDTPRQIAQNRER